VRTTITLAMVALVGAAGCRAEPQAPTPISKRLVTAPVAYRALSTVASAGSVTGTVTYSGPTKDSAVAVNRDQTTCGVAAEGLSGALIVTEGRVANAVVEVIGVTEGIGFEPSTLKIDNVGCMFVPRVALARVGDTFLSHNSDPVFHNAKLDLIAKGKSKRIANLPVPLQGTDSPARVLKKPGVIKVSCDAHLWMRSTLYVTSHPYSSLTGTDGGFTIPQLPPGHYTLKVWHEVLGEKTMPLTVQANADARADLVL
jgi:hypothetical protein